MRLCKEVLKHEYHLLNESNKKIERYTSIINKYSKINDNVYEKVELYKNKLTIIKKNIEESENVIINQVEKIIKEINEYIKNPNNYINLVATEKYYLLKNNLNNSINSNDSINNNIDIEKEIELSNEIERIFQIEKNIREDLRLINNFVNDSKPYFMFNPGANVGYNDLLSTNMIDLNHMEKIKELDNEIDNYYKNISNCKNKQKEVLDKITKELYEKIDFYYGQRCKVIDQRVKITSNIEHIIQFINNHYNINFSNNLKYLFETNIWNILENKKLDNLNVVSGKKFLENYINLFYPELKDMYHEFKNHYYIVKEIYLSKN